MFLFKPGLFAKIASTPAPRIEAISPGFSRADHARMLAHAAKRRLAARDVSEEGAYWKACAPAAIAKAVAIRTSAGFAPLP